MTKLKSPAPLAAVRGSKSQRAAGDYSNSSNLVKLQRTLFGASDRDSRDSRLHALRSDRYAWITDVAMPHYGMNRDAALPIVRTLYWRYANAAVEWCQMHGPRSFPTTFAADEINIVVQMAKGDSDYEPILDILHRLIAAIRAGAASMPADIDAAIAGHFPALPKGVRGA
ncbi:MULTISPECIES: hypothetical protein [Pseudomonadota]|jgi:hypothetical protein|uniref:hypothetical protein n=1 Tax=Pseudomonadota TaxID=1224 RepID=UPI000824A716|nr:MULTISPECIES: hypothetical protein [Pseudomonadota]